MLVWNIFFWLESDICALLVSETSSNKDLCDNIFADLSVFHLLVQLFIYISDIGDVAPSGSNSSLMDADDMLQAVESDESL